MSFFTKLFGQKDEMPDEPRDDQAVLIELNGTSLPDQVYEDCDLDQFEEKLVGALGELGEYDGNEAGPESTTVYLYGPNAEAMFAAIEKILIDYPLSAGARVIVRRGGPGSDQRVVDIPSSYA